MVSITFKLFNNNNYKIKIVVSLKKTKKKKVCGPNFHNLKKKKKKRRAAQKVCGKKIIPTVKLLCLTKELIKRDKKSYYEQLSCVYLKSCYNLVHLYDN